MRVAGGRGVILPRLGRLRGSLMMIRAGRLFGGLRSWPMAARLCLPIRRVRSSGSMVRGVPG